MNIRGHSLQRAMERCPGVCPAVLIRRIHDELLTGRFETIEPIGQNYWDPLVWLYRVRLETGKTVYILANEVSFKVITFLEVGMKTRLSQGWRKLGANNIYKAKE